MTTRDTLTMFLLAALWGGSFLFLRQAAPLVGPVLVVAVRTLGATLMLLPFVIWQRQGTVLLGYWRPLIIAALLSTVLPFLGLTQAARSLPAGLLSILNATTPLWGAVVGWLWAGERLSGKRIFGLVLGFAGVALLATSHGQINADNGWAAVLAVCSTLMYALSVHYNKHYLVGLRPLGVSAGTMAMSAFILTLPAVVLGPVPVSHDGVQLEHAARWAAMPPSVWWSLAGLAVLCTGFAYLLFYSLIDRIGASKTLTVTFLIPAFGMLWGALFLHEHISLLMVGSASVIVLGTLLSTKDT